MASKRITELNIAEINRELSKRGIQTSGSKVDKLVILEEYIRTKDHTDPETLWFEQTNESSAKVLVEETSDAQSNEDEVNDERSLSNLFMEQMSDRLEGLELTVDKQQQTIATLSENLERVERELSEEKRKSTERVVQASSTYRGHFLQPFTSDISGANKIRPDEIGYLPEKTHQVSSEDRWSNIWNRLSEINLSKRIVSGVSGNQSGVSDERSDIFGEISGVPCKMPGSNHEKPLRSSFSGEKRVHFSDSLLIPQNELSMARTSIPEFAGKREEDPLWFLLQAEAVLEETGIHKARWVTVLAPQLKAQAGTWWGTMRAMNLPWQEFKSELLEKFNGEELHSRLQSKLVSTAQTKTETLGEFVLQKYQLFRRFSHVLTEETVVRTVTHE